MRLVEGLRRGSIRQKSHGLFATLPALFLGILPATDAPRFTPKAGTSIRRTLELNGVREMRSMTIKIGDKEQKIEDVEVSNRLATKTIVLDEYLEVADERVTKLERTFESLTKRNTESRKAPGAKEPPKEVSETCELEGLAVVFTWNAEKKAFVPKVKSGEHDATMLAKLNQDMDYTELLPKSDVAEGAKWELELADVKTALLRPAGYLPFKPERKPPPMEVRLRDAAWDGTTGHLVLAWHARPEVDGMKLAAITFEGTMSVDGTVAREGEKNAPDKLSTRSSENIHGELVWDIARGGPRSIEWTSKGTVTVGIQGKQPTQGGPDIEMEQIMAFDQEYTFKGSFEIP